MSRKILPFFVLWSLISISVFPLVVNSIEYSTFQRELIGKVPLYYTEGAEEITSGDFNNDGLQDLATVHGPGQVFIWFNRGAGVFEEIQIGNVSDGTWGVCSGDFNGDGWDDLATSVRSGPICIFYNEGNEVFEKVYVGAFPEDGEISGFTSGDFDDDGWIDLALGAEWWSISEQMHHNELYVLYNKGDNIFEKVHIGEEIAPDMILKQIASGDLDQDGLIDLAACTVYGGVPSKVFIFYNLGDNIFEPIYLGCYEDDITGFTLGDFNKDGLIDLVACPLYDHLYIIYNMGDGNFTDKVFIGYVGAYASGLTTGDFDENGFLDVAACNMGSSEDPWSRVYIFYNQGDNRPPTTFDDYDGLWHTEDFTITLTTTDDLSDVAETYYMINDGPIQNVSIHGHPLITTEGANNTLEYWIVDNAGNEGTHEILTEIKLDKTKPTANAGQDQTVTAGETVTFDAGGSTDNLGVASYEWDFADGTNGTGVTATHTYTGSGTYTVILTVSDAAENSARDTVTITVQDEPEFPWTTVGAGAAITILVIAAVYFIVIKKTS